MQTLRHFGLIGFPLSHSFSASYFAEKFEREGFTDCRYSLYPMEDIRRLPDLVGSVAGLQGLNVTIPHKQAVLPFLDEIDKEAARIGAVNVIRIRDDRLTGFNSDVYGFEQSLIPFIRHARSGLRALVLGTGGASRAVTFVLGKRGIPFSLVSRVKAPGVLTYDELDQKTMENHQLIVQTTPLGTFPETDKCPDIPYHHAGKDHYFYDLVYNPPETEFMKRGKAMGAAACNGMDMLVLQAERAWEIWNGK